MTVFQEVKSMLPVSGDAYDGEIVLQIKAAAKDRGISKSELYKELL